MQKNIGIWGFGIVGKATLQFLRSKRFLRAQQKNPAVSIWDVRKLGSSERNLLRQLEAKQADATLQSVEDFLENHDYIIVSPGVDLRPFARFSNKLMGELDLFAQFFNKPTVAITGTLGKTTTTKLLWKLASILPAMPLTALRKEPLQKMRRMHRQSDERLRVVYGGNTGSGILNLIDKQEQLDLALLELSSFQLALNTSFAPDIALWTNFYPNHLDRHDDLASYFAAKWQLIASQSSKQVALFPLDVHSNRFFKQRMSCLQSQVCFVSSQRPSPSILQESALRRAFFFYQDDAALHLLFHHQGTWKSARLLALDKMPEVTFLENWLFILATLYILGNDLSLLESYDWHELARHAGMELDIDPHRLELCGSRDGIDFYNDSKATVVQATQAALRKLSLHGRPIILFLGGISKGVDRQPLLEQARNMLQVKQIICFGKEWKCLCEKQGYASLQEAFTAMAAIVQPGDQVLFSPSGASFDLFANYEERGNCFKQLVREFCEEKKEIAR